MYSPTPADRNVANRAHWDERVPLHVAGDFYDLDAFRAGQDPLRDFELAEVGDVGNRSLLHLQCHIGLDTLSWARHGAARVVGLDFSEPAIDLARGLAHDLGLGPDRAAFVAADVYDAAAGRRIEFLDEHDVSLFRRFGSFERRDGYFRFPADRPRIPLMYSIRARKN